MNTLQPITLHSWLLFSLIMGMAISTTLCLVACIPWEKVKRIMLKRQTYEIMYDYLEMIVKNDPVNETTYNRACKMFNDLADYSCRDKEKLDVLYRQFERKYGTCKYFVS